MDQIVKEKVGDCEEFDDPGSHLPSSHGSLNEGAFKLNVDHVETVVSALRIVLLGKSEDKKTKLGNFIIGGQEKGSQFPKHCVAVCSEWRGKLVTVVKTSDMFSLSEENLRKEVKRSMNLCSPGPNVLLLLVKPSEFDRGDKEKLEFILSLFGQDAFKYSMMMITDKMKETDSNVNLLIEQCGGRNYNMSESHYEKLMEKIEMIVDENKGTFLTFTESDPIKPALNLVLFGRRGSGKTSAAKSILGQTELHSASNSSECVRNEGEVCGRWVSLVELPALYGKPQETVMEESFRCVSLCDPEGVHAFILVLPVGPLTDEDKGELETIQNTFSSRVNDFTMILFTVDSDPTAPAVGNFLQGNKEIQDLCQSCGGRSVVLNVRDNKQVSEVINMVDEMRIAQTTNFTKDVFIKTQMKEISKLKAELQHLKQKSNTGGDDDQGKEPLRMMLIGKTGCGKSSTGNTILGAKHFTPRITPKPPGRSCETATGQISGRPVTVVRTPPLFDSTLSEDEVQHEIEKCIRLSFPGPHVFLLVLQIRNFTQEDKDSVELIRKYFGRNSQDFVIIIFTRGDELEDQPFENYIEDCGGFVKQLIKDCGGRYQVFNNRDNTKSTQVQELLEKIEKLVKDNGGNCYNYEMFANTEEFIRVRAERIVRQKEEEMKRKEEELRRKYEKDLTKVKEEAEQELRRKYEKDLTKVKEEAEQEIKLREKQLKEKDESINKEQEERRRERAEEEKKWKKFEETMRQDWRNKEESSERIIQSEREQRENAEKKLEQYRREMMRDRDAWDKEKKDMWEQKHQELKQNLEEENRKRSWTFVVMGLLFFLFLLYHLVLGNIYAENYRGV